MTYDDEYPSRLGPPAVVNYGGPKMLDATKPVYPVELDAGAFRALWELLESEAKRRYPTHTMSGTRAIMRAVVAFRSAYWAQNEPPSPPVEKKRLIRKTPQKR